MLDQLPNELIRTTVSNLLHVDLKSLSLVSHWLRGITLPFLFRSLEFTHLTDCDDQDTHLRLTGLAASKTIHPYVHAVKISGEHRSNTDLSPPPFDMERTLAVSTITPYTLFLLFPNLRDLWLDVPLDNTNILALVNLATRVDIELFITRCQMIIDVAPVSAFELRIVSLYAARDFEPYSDALRVHASNIYHIISASSRHLRHLALGLKLFDIIDRLLQIKFDSLHILQLDEQPTDTIRVSPSTLSKFLRQLGPLDKLILSPSMMVDPEILFEGASEPPHYNSLEASYQVCRILLPNNTVASLRCHSLLGQEISKSEERELVPIIEDGLRKNQKPLHELEIAICGQEEDRILASLASVCSASLKSLHVHIPISVSQMGIDNMVS
jgi:hypothetical protein